MLHSDLLSALDNLLSDIIEFFFILIILYFLLVSVASNSEDAFCLALE